ncbi:MULTISPECIES: small-conductance mechanosensitive channel MscS [Helicobacter]|uniref:Mechanosensitive ion channel n=6 Tax=Helicobacter typhlonius TaxID=76936 RepID=A0A099UE95_9HELI|nr:MULTISPECIES: mechanosensitive ion channel domain-containing protein [Helicobacter]TLD78697.1 mechanosensitive ion channel [Helicobacter typhlonius]TLD89487.1 mechanosensitive ion channel [Helicobacter sp. MIT 03-1616]CUU40025.1 Small-conductance mechanosensitive channel [Helicobacter typhlonius]
MQELKHYFIDFIPQIQQLSIGFLKAALILIIGYYLSRFVANKIRKAIAKQDEILARFIGQVIFVLLLVVMIIAALGTIGVQTNSIIAVLGTAGVAIALGLKDSLSSVASGIVLIILRPFKKGDLIEVSGLIGNVEAINLFTTNLRLSDGKFAIIPNSNMATANIINTTYNDQRRIELIIGVGYESDIESVKNIIIEVLQSTPEVDLQQQYFIGLTELGASSLNFTLRFWVKLEYGVLNTQSKVLESIKTNLDKNGIEIPYNKLDINIAQAPKAN